MSTTAPIVLYEDNHIIVVYKEAGILSQADITNDPDMLSMVREYLRTKYQKPGNVFVGLVHRLDRMTEGIMVFAKTSKAASRLSEAIKNQQFHKWYLAVVEGAMPLHEQSRLVNYLSKDVDTFVSHLADSITGKEAVLTYEVLTTTKDTSLLKVELETGRHHQIRVQLASIKHPIVGDTLYGAKELQPLALAAYHLAFIHPVTKQQLIFERLPKRPIFQAMLDANSCI